MNRELHLPSHEEAVEFSDQFDRMVSSTLRELAERRARERFEIIMDSTKEGLSSPVRVGATVYIANAVENDPEVTKYDEPSDADLLAVLDKAQSYAGDWYHSRVALKFYESWSPLQREVAELDEESGVFIIFDYSCSKSTAEEYEKLINEDRS